MARVVIVGGGVVGLCSALALLERNVEVTVIDADGARTAASWGNAGHLATEQVAPLAAPATLAGAWGRRFAAGGALDLPWEMAGTWLPFAARFVAASTPRRFARGKAALGGLLAGAIPAWRRRLEPIGADRLLREDGHLVVWNTPKAADRGLAAWHAADTGVARFAAAAPADLRRIAALTTAPVAAAIRFVGTGQITDLAALADALERALLDRGGRLVRRAAVLRRAGDDVRIEGVEGDAVLVAAGARSGALMAAAGHRVPLIAERGYHLRGGPGGWPTDLPPVVFEERSMIVTRYRDTLQAASFVEFGRADAPPDPRKWARLEANVAELGLGFAPPLTRWMGARPTLPDYLPAIGRSRRARNLLYAFGHQHLGLTLAAITGEAVAALAVDEPDAAIAPFALDRFGGRA